MSYFDGPKIHKPTMQVWRLPNGYWLAFPPYAGVTADTKAEGIARLKKEFPEIKTWIVNDYTKELSHAVF